MTTTMAAEIAEIPDVVARIVGPRADPYRDVGARLRTLAPPFAVTCARGTSDHAATYFKYLAELQAGVPVASIGPSVASVYRRRLALGGAACLTISQSGASSDLVMLQQAAREGGALTVALVNDATSPVAAAAELTAPLFAGPERAVAATKTFVASLAAVASIVAAWTDDRRLGEALRALPESLSAAQRIDWSAAMQPIAEARSVFSISRGPGLAVAQEAALKLKETCRLHAEAYSAAEVRHGPIALARDRFAALAFATRDEGRESVLQAVAAMRGSGARVFVIDSAEGGDDRLALPPAPHPLLDPICQVTAFYGFVEQLATALGHDPDRPENLSKVTDTV